MRILTMMMVAMAAAACASPQPLPRARLAPPLQLEPPAVIVGREEAEAVRADRDQSPPVPLRAEPYFDGDDSNAAPPTYRTIVETVEVVVEVSGQVVSVSSGRRYSTYDDDLYHRRSYRAGRPSRFPVNTAVGAGIGAIIGHQSGRRDRGALIGGGIGLLFDLSRWSR